MRKEKKIEELHHTHRNSSGEHTMSSRGSPQKGSRPYSSISKSTRPLSGIAGVSGRQDNHHQQPEISIRDFQHDLDGFEGPASEGLSPLKENDSPLAEKKRI